jgi:hypothetical protein
LSTGSVVVTFTDESVTWIVKASKSKQVEAKATKESARTPSVIPLVACRAYEKGFLKAKLGYNNPAPYEQVIPVGKLNGFSKGARDRGQPSTFFSGLNVAVFNIPLTDPLDSITWNLNGAEVTIDPTTTVCSGMCIDTPVGAIKLEIDQAAVDLSALIKRAASALSSVKDSRKGQQVRSKNKRDAIRAQAKAALYEKLAKELTIQIPAVTKTCPEAPAFCVTVDRFGTIEALKGLYAIQRETVIRMMARTIFKATGKTVRSQPLVRKAKEVEQRGLKQLGLLPRFAVECK